VGRGLSIILALMLACFFPASSCSRGERGNAPSKGEAREIRKEYQKGPLRVRFLLDRDSMTVAENLELTIEAEASEGYAVELPALSEKLGDFSMVDDRHEPPRLSTEGRLHLRQVWTLEPFLPGDYRIPPLKVAFVRQSTMVEGEDSSQQEEIATEPVDIKVRSVLAEKGGESRPNPIFGPVELAREPMELVYAFTAAAALLGCGGAALLWLRKTRKRNTPLAAALLPHESAYSELQAILDENLVEKGLFKLFYARVSDVLRRYIEARFALHASTLTTQEFLARISRKSPFSWEQQKLLDEFLGHCDLVKFAELQPTPGEIHKTLEAFRAFVEATKEERVEVVET
jgi:hypothetical protein